MDETKCPFECGYPVDDDLGAGMCEAHALAWLSSEEYEAVCHNPDAKKAFHEGRQEAGARMFAEAKALFVQRAREAK